MSAVKELGLKITAETLAEHLNCPVCMNRLRGTHMTPCGHRYCEKCITEWINIRHNCPCCNRPVEKAQLIKDSQFDNLLDAITSEETAAETQYFDTLISAAAHGAINLGNGSSPEEMPISAAADTRQLFSPVEQVLKEHLRRSLASHERFYQDLKREHRRRHSEIAGKVNQTMADLSNTEISPEELARRRQVLEAEANQKSSVLDDELNRCTGLVADAYDRYLTEHIPELSILPVTVGVSLLSKGRQLFDVVLKPNDSLEDLQRLICEQLNKDGDDVVEFSDDVKYLCFSPFAKRSIYEMLQTASDIIERNSAPPDVTLLPRECKPVLQCAVRPGSEIAVYGMVRCKSDLPKHCFVTTFIKNASMDYFHCKNCSMKWICRPCMDVCHKDHDVVPLIMNHNPTWACCYCPKNKKCLIQN